MNIRRWLIAQSDRLKSRELEAATGLRPLTVRLLLNRGLDTPEKISGFLDKYNIPLHDPMLLNDMDKAVARVRRAIEQKERVLIYGDYDVDGVTSTVMLYSYLRGKGLECDYFIPERITEGYGLSLPVIEKMKGKVDLIITVDTGVTAIDEADYAASIGIDMVITDHHSCRETLPKAAAVVNPHREDCDYPFKNLAGVGVVFKLLCALEGSTERILDDYSDIIAVGTVADVMPIEDENRRITAVGLKKLACTENVGLKALMKSSGIIKPNRESKKITSATVGYVLAPRINAAGRIAFASRAVELLLASDEDEADKIADELCEINKLRQTTEQEIYEQAIELIKREFSDDKFLVLANEGWHQGVIGVVASKIAERYSRPCVLFSLDGGVAKGSGRSIKGFSLMDALTECGDVLTEYGGHELAAGLSMERSRIAEFRKRINDYAASRLTVSDSAVPIEADCECEIGELTVEGIDEILKLEPFGLSNPQPLLVIRCVTVKEIVPISMGKHVRFRLCRGGKSINAVYFGMPSDSFAYCEDDVCDVVCTAEINEFMGSRTAQVFIKAMAPSESVMKELTAEEKKYERLIGGTPEPGDEKEIPDLNSFRAVFKFLRRETGHEGRKMSYYYARTGMSENFGADVSYCKLRLILDILSEQKLIDYKNFGGTAFWAKLNPTDTKTNIDDSELLKRLRSGSGEKNA